MIDVSETIDRPPATAPREVRYCLDCGASSTRPDLDFQVRRVYCDDTGREEEAAFCHGEQCVAGYLRPSAAGWSRER